MCVFVRACTSNNYFCYKEYYYASAHNWAKISEWNGMEWNGRFKMFFLQLMPRVKTAFLKNNLSLLVMGKKRGQQPKAHQAEPAAATSQPAMDTTAELLQRLKLLEEQQKLLEEQLQQQKLEQQQQKLLEEQQRQQKLEQQQQQKLLEEQQQQQKLEQQQQRQELADLRLVATAAAEPLLVQFIAKISSRMLHGDDELRSARGHMVTLVKGGHVPDVTVAQR